MRTGEYHSAFVKKPEDFDRESDCWQCFVRPRAMMTHPTTGEKIKSVYCEHCSGIPHATALLQQRQSI